jgi:hypothetical protein
LECSDFNLILASVVLFPFLLMPVKRHGKLVFLRDNIGDTAGM